MRPPSRPIHTHGASVRRGVGGRTMCVLNYAWSKFVRAAFIFRVHRSNLDVWSAEAACVRASTFRLFGSYGRSAAGTESPNLFPLSIYLSFRRAKRRGKRQRRVSYSNWIRALRREAAFVTRYASYRSRLMAGDDTFSFFFFFFVALVRTDQVC